MTRLRVSADGSIRLPPEIGKSLGWPSGSYLEVSVKRNRLELRRVEVDPFAEALKEPDQDAFDKILKKQEKSRSEAFEAFEKGIRRSPEDPDS